MKFRSASLFALLAVFALFTIESCKHNPSFVLMPVDTTGNGNGNNNSGPVDTSHYVPRHSCSPDSVYFQNDILPLITSNCAMSGCHDGSGGYSDDKRPLTSYAEIIRYVKVTKPTSSKLYTILSARGEDQMPPTPKPALSKTQDSLILAWIKQGAPNNKCDGNCDTTNITYSGTIFPLIQAACLGCHSGSQPSGSISLTNYQEVKAQANSGKLLGSVTYSYGFKAMPASGPLSDCDVNAIRIWIRDGAANN